MQDSKKGLSGWYEKNRHIIIVGLVIGVLLLIAVLTPRPNYPEVSAQRLADDPTLGASDALITIIEYGDYACEGCEYWHNSGILESILDRYDGEVKFVWRDNARQSFYSKDAAMAGQCAYDQGGDAFWAYHDILFENPTGFGEESLKSYADMVGLNREQFDRCLESDQYYKKVLHNQKQAGKFGFSFTPAFTINEKIVLGPPAESVMVEMIEAILAQK